MGLFPCSSWASRAREGAPLLKKKYKKKKGAEPLVSSNRAVENPQIANPKPPPPVIVPDHAFSCRR
jgi:hypothetical protein